jgi:hypothetical protein
VTNRQLGAQAALALLGLSAAYLTWQRGPDLEPGEVFVVDMGRGELTGVRFEDQEKSTWVELSMTSDQTGSFVSVRLSPQEKVLPGKDKAMTKTPERLVRGSEAAATLFRSFTPLRASRALGVLDAGKLKDLGLDAAKAKRITLALRSGPRTFAIAPAPPGGNEPYLRDESNGQVYLVARSFLSDFQSAVSMLVDRRLHAFKVEEADRIFVQHGSKKKEFVVARGDGGIRIAAAASPDQPDATAKTWHDRIFSLWPTEVLGKDEVPAEGTPQVDVRVEYNVRGHSLGFMEIARPAAIESTKERPKDGKDTLFAHSEHTLGWFKLSMDAQTLAGDLDRLLR